MAMNYVQQNLASEMQAIAFDLLKLKNRLSVVSAMYLAESMGTLTDQDYQDIGGQFAHLTVVEMLAAKNALDSVDTNLGAYVAGTNAFKLMKLVVTVP